VVDSSAALIDGHVVALLFAADEPLEIGELSRILGVRQRQVQQALDRLAESPPLGLLIQRNGDSLQLVTQPSSAEYVRRLRGLDSQTRLSRGALESLAIVAYKQPVTRAEVDAIRGVNSDHAMSTLITRELIEEVGRRDTVGRPVLFGTTMHFLELLGLDSLAGLPTVMGVEQLEAP
jgi:segregation and condensation protein B